MKVSPHLVGLYNRSVRRYRKLSAQLRRQTNPAGYTYQTILARIRKLRRKIATLQVQLKIATATGVVALALSISPAEAQMNTGPMVPQSRYQNPLREAFLFEAATYPTLVDLDKDGDYDLVVGDESNWSKDDQYRTLRYFVNIGTTTSPLFEEKFGVDNPFADLYIPRTRRAPAFADIDNDGDQDLFVSTSYYYYYEDGNRIQYFRNDNGVFTEQTGSWNPTLKTGNPFDGFDRDNIKLAFADIDKDNDLDALITGSVYDGQNGGYRYVNYYKNDGKGVFTEANDALQFTPVPSQENIGNPEILNPTFADIDKDGDDDLVFGGYYLGLRYYKQVSPGKFEEQTGAFDPVAKTGNPFEDIYEPDTQPVFADLDGDGDVELLLGDGDGDQSYDYFSHIIHYFENNGNGVFEEKRDLDNTLSGVNARTNASTLLVDLDDDGDLDAVVGHKYDRIYDGNNAPFEYVFDGGRFHRRYED
ncbi:MAG: VCBS repeat-containing protein, partial [Bacteroidota bacterium]|nr:VCBS repeat-containing protein [Bacteroidota bacterium]